MTDDELVRHVNNEFLEDARWRDKCIGGQSAFKQSLDLYESTGKPANGSDIPELPQIREPVNDAISLAVGTNQRTRLVATETVDPRMAPEERAYLVTVLQKAADINNRHVDNILEINQFQDLRTRALTHAGIFGVGYIKVSVANAVDTRSQFAARRLEKKPLEYWTDQDFALYNVLRRSIDIQHIDTRDVFWMRGVPSVYSPDMLRCYTLEKRSAHEMRDLYPGKDIRPGIGPYHMQEANYPVPNDRNTTVGVLTMWQLEANPIVKILGDEMNPEARIPINGWNMTRVKLAGRVLLEREVFNGSDGPLRLPITPYYLMMSENHPYGFSLAKALKITSDYINTMYTMLFEQARKTISPQSIVILASKLASTDNIEDIEKKLRDGDAIALYGNQDVDNINQIVQPTGQLSSGMSPAPLQAIRMAEGLMRRYASTPDREAIASAESGKAKETEIAIADRTKTPMADIVARGDEDVKDIIYENVRIFHNNMIDVPIRGEQGDIETTTLNKPEVKVLPINDPVTGLPMQHESFVVPEVNPDGFAFKRLEYTANSTQIDMKAQAEGRGDLPVSWKSRVRLFAQLLQLGALKSPRTMRDYSLPEEIAARDETNAQEDQQEQMKQMQQQMQMQMQMQAGGDGAAGKPPGPGGPSRQQQQRNAQTGRNAPQPQGAYRDLKQEMAMDNQG